MIMESGRGKGMHNTQERAALLPGHSSTFPWLPQQAQEPERFPHLLHHKDSPGEFVPGQGEHEELPQLLHQGHLLR